MVAPHSHPVLTLNTQLIAEPNRHLMLLLHEQMHWFFDVNGRALKIPLFIEKIKAK
jgi:hypothetical protein